MSPFRPLCVFLLLGVGLITNVRASDVAGDWQSMVARIDELLGRRCVEEGVEPAPLAADSEFVRRVHLDLTGVTPFVADVRWFLEDDTPHKRSQLIERLLQSPAHVTHLANTWRDIMLPATISAEQFGNSSGLHAWLRRQFADNLRYDRIVSDLVAATSSEQDGPALFFTALQLEPKKLAADTARIFLGLQMQCAECHDHPFDRWTQEDFWGYAAFFARLPKVPAPRARFRLVDLDRGEVSLPDTDELVPPRYPGGTEAEASLVGTRRQQLSIWLASPENPYVARAAVNRVWALFFGRGLVHPVDDLGPHNPPSHPQLMDELSEYFTDSGYDLRNLFRTLANTKAYQRTSQLAGETPPPPELLASMSIKVLTAAQLYDSLSRCLSTSSLGDRSEFNRGVDIRRQTFVTRMQARSRDATEYNTGLQQALNLMNGGEVFEATSVGRGSLLTSLEAPFLTDAQRIEVIYLATLSRFPTAAEQARCRKHLELVKSDPAHMVSGLPLLFPLLSTFTDATLGKNLAAIATATAMSDDKAVVHMALSDILWAILNSAEFTLNH